MSDLVDIRTALIDTITAHVETDLYGYRAVEGPLNLPAVIVKPGGGGRDDKGGDFLVTHARGTEIWMFELIVLCPRTDEGTGQDLLDELISKTGVNSIRQAIWDTPALGLGDVDATVTGMSNYGGEYSAARVPNVGAALQVKVHAF